MATAPVRQPGKVAYVSGLSLPEYASIVGYDECRFYGVNTGDNLQYQCREYWTGWQRSQLQHYLDMAQGMIEEVLGFHLSPKWDTNEEQSPTNPLESNWAKVIAAGIRAEAVIESGAAVDYALNAGFATIGPIATTATNSSEIFIYNPIDGLQIEPQQIVIEPAGATVFVPRCRMVKPEFAEKSVPYDEDANFLATVDVKRVYNDASVNADIVYADGCDCAVASQTACMTLELADIGKWRVQPAVYDSGTATWVSDSLECHGRAYSVKLNYLSGTSVMSITMKSAVIRLAHSLMPAPPCGCKDIISLWKRDRNAPLVTDRERLNWRKIALANQVGWMGIL